MQWYVCLALEEHILLERGMDMAYRVEYRICGTEKKPEGRLCQKGKGLSAGSILTVMAVCLMSVFLILGYVRFGFWIGKFRQALEVLASELLRGRSFYWAAAGFCAELMEYA